VEHAERRAAKQKAPGAARAWRADQGACSPAAKLAEEAPGGYTHCVTAGCVRYSRIVGRSHESDTTMRSTFSLFLLFLLGFAAPQLLIWLGLWPPRQLGLRALRL
jgi:hypothetical protein